MNGEDAVFCYSGSVAFPDNFIIEFDIIPDAEYTYGIRMTLYEEDPEDPKEINDDLYPGKSGLHIAFKKTGWETKGYTKQSGGRLGGRSGHKKSGGHRTGESCNYLDTVRSRRFIIRGQRHLTCPQISTHIQSSTASSSGWTPTPSRW
ncbi:MAG: hypothetical protein R2756_03315 [Bacteroidales bacterium]